MKRNLVVVVIVIIVAVVAFFVGQDTQVVKPQAETKQADKVEKVTFAGAEKHEVTLGEAKKYIQRYQKSVQLQKTKSPKNHGGSFDRDAIDKILAQPGCNALRFYYGRDEKGKPNLVLVGVDTTGKDMTKGIIMEKSQDCPPHCYGESELMR